MDWEKNNIKLTTEEINIEIRKMATSPSIPEFRDEEKKVRDNIQSLA